MTKDFLDYCPVIINDDYEVVSPHKTVNNNGEDNEI